MFKVFQTLKQISWLTHAPKKPNTKHTANKIKDYSQICKKIVLYPCFIVVNVNFGENSCLFESFCKHFEDASKNEKKLNRIRKKMLTLLALLAELCSMDRHYVALGQRKKLFFLKIYIHENVVCVSKYFRCCFARLSSRMYSKNRVGHKVFIVCLHYVLSSSMRVKRFYFFFAPIRISIALHCSLNVSLKLFQVFVYL